MITDIITKSVTKGSHYNNKWYNRTSMAFLYSLITYEDINNIITRMAKYNVHNMLLYIRKCLFNAAIDHLNDANISRPIQDILAKIDVIGPTYTDEMNPCIEQLKASIRRLDTYGNFISIRDNKYGYSESLSLIHSMSVASICNVIERIKNNLVNVKSVTQYILTSLLNEALNPTTRAKNPHKKKRRNANEGMLCHNYSPELLKAIEEPALTRRSYSPEDYAALLS